jgi:peptide/nickel transport system substrate-binding protein
MGRPTAAGYYLPVAVESFPTYANGGVRDVVESGRTLMRTDWKIRDDIYWGDGTPLTGHDYRFTIEISADPRSNATDPEANGFIDRVEVDQAEPRRFSIYFARKAWSYYRRLGRALPAHIEEPIWNACARDGSPYAERSAYVTNPTNPGLYCGPYVVARYDAEGALLTRNPHWPGPTRHNEVQVIFLQGAADPRLPDVDVLASPNIGASDVPLLERVLSASHERLVRHGYWITQVAFNMRRGPCADPAVRRALRDALQSIEPEKLLWGELGVAARTLLPRRVHAALPPAVASGLAEPVMRANGGGAEVPFHYGTSPLAERFVERLIPAAEAHGVRLRPVPYTSGRFFGDMRSGRLEGAYLLATHSTSEPFVDELFGEGSVPDEAIGRQGENWSLWETPELQDLVDRNLLAFDFLDRLPTYESLERLCARDVPAAPLVYGPSLLYVRRGLAGMAPALAQMHETCTLEAWG